MQLEAISTTSGQSDGYVRIVSRGRRAKAKETGLNRLPSVLLRMF